MPIPCHSFERSAPALDGLHARIAGEVEQLQRYEYAAIHAMQLRHDAVELHHLKVLHRQRMDVGVVVVVVGDDSGTDFFVLTLRDFAHGGRAPIARAGRVLLGQVVDVLQHAGQHRAIAR